MIDPKKKVLESTSGSIANTHERHRLHRIESRESTLTGGKRHHKKIVKQSNERRWNRDNFQFPKYPNRYKIY